MSTPRDPAQPGSPGGVPGSGQAPQAGRQPIGGTSQAAPPAGYQPPPGYRPPDNSRQPSGGQGLDWGAEPAPRRSYLRRHGCLISMVGFLVLVLILVVGCVVVLTPALAMDLKLTSDLGSRAQQVTFNIEDGNTVWTIHLAPGAESRAADIACHVVRPDLAGTEFAGDHFQLVDAAGHVLADDNTPCG